MQNILNNFTYQLSEIKIDILDFALLDYRVIVCLYSQQARISDVTDPPHYDRGESNYVIASADGTYIFVNT